MMVGEANLDPSNPKPTTENESFKFFLLLLLYPAFLNAAEDWER